MNSRVSRLIAAASLLATALVGTFGSPARADATWSPLGAGIASGQVNAIVADASGALYVGGSFTTAGGVTVNNVAKYDPGTGAWSALGSGVTGTVNALAVDAAGNVYAGGNFTAAGSVTTGNIAKWSPSGSGTWSALSSGISGGQVNALAIDSAGSVYVGGTFTTAGGVSANKIAKWTPSGSGSGWSALRTGVGGTVNALAIDSAGSVYVGGGFTTADGATANRIAKWDGTAWSALGSGVDSNVWALAVGGGVVYVAGDFTTAGGASADKVATWNPAGSGSWAPLGAGLDGRGTALALDSSGRLFAGGAFSTAGGISADKVAMWDGGAWSALGSGVNGQVLAITAVASGSVYAGGLFTTAGGSPANRIARVIPPTPSVGDPGQWIVVQQALPEPAGGCAAIAGDAAFAYGTGLSGGWIRSWQFWSRPGTGEYVCSRWLVNRGAGWQIEHY